MAVQLKESTRTARLDQIDTDVGTAGLLEVWTGTQPANCAATDSGSKLCTINLPNPAFAAASAGTMAKSGTWSGTAAASGTAGHFRIKSASGTSTTVIQGSIGLGSGDLSFDNTSIATSQTVTVSTFTLTDGNA